VTWKPSPIRVLDRAIGALHDAGWRVWVTAGLAYLLPYLLGFFVIYKPLLDGSRPDLTFGTEYFVRYYGFILWFFLVRMLTYASVGQLLYDAAIGHGMNARAMAMSLPRRLLRALPVYLPIIVTVYIGEFMWIVPGAVIAYFAAFVLPGYVLGGLSIAAAWREGARLRHHRNLPLLIGFALITAFGRAASYLLNWLNAMAHGLLTFEGASILLALWHMAMEVAQLALLTGLYFSAREREIPPDETAALF